MAVQTSSPPSPGEPPAYAIQQGMAIRLTKQFVGCQKINFQYRKSNICQKKFPRKILILESQLRQAVSPARNELTCRAKQLGTCGRQIRTVWKDAVGGTGIHEETPVQYLVQHVDQLPGRDSVEPPWTAPGRLVS
jgi:hypothetical protein